MCIRDRPPPLLQLPPVSSARDPGCPEAANDPDSPVDQEVPPPLASTDPAAPDGEGVDEPPALPQVEATPDAVAEATDAATQSTAAWGDEAGTDDDPLASSSTGMASWARPTLTYDYMACSLRPHWKEGQKQAVAWAEELFASTAVSYTHLTLPTNREV